jgi:hypothetical protein
LVDLFDEVEEQLRSDRYVALVRRAAPWITAIFALVLVGYFGFWGFRLFEERNQAAATIEYQKGVDALSDNDQKAALGHFQAVAKSGPPAYRSLALMQEGGLSQIAGKDEEAARDFDQAARLAPQPILGDLAQLRAALAVLDEAPYPQLERRLKPLTESKRPYAFQAREALAMARLMAGKTAEAKSDFTGLQSALDAPEDMRQRAAYAAALIDSSEAPTAVASVKAALKGAATMPPLAAPNVPAPPSGATGQGGPSQAPAGAAQ